MKLVQKIPAALAIACLLMMSGCSKEDVVAPEPRVEGANTNSNLKVDVSVVTPSIATTQWYTGEDVLPTAWERNVTGFSGNKVLYPTGVSSISNLWGNPSLPFVQGMVLGSWAKNVNTFITVTTNGIAHKSLKSSVKTKIRHLTPGKTYRLTVYVGSSLPKALPGTFPATFAKQALLSVQNSTTYQDAVVDLSSLYNSWSKKVFTFKAYSSDMDFAFSASPGRNGQFAYAHLLVPNNAIIEEQ